MKRSHFVAKTGTQPVDIPLRNEVVVEEPSDAPIKSGRSRGQDRYLHFSVNAGWMQSESE
jgi:hypothetical protein